MKIIKNAKLPLRTGGLYADVPLSVYHSAELTGDQPSVSSSSLRVMWKHSPKMFFHTWKHNPKRAEEDETTETKYMMLGRAAHHILLGEPDFKRYFDVQPDSIIDDDGDLVPWHNNRKVCKEWHAKKRKAGITILTKDQYEQIRGMGHALNENLMVKDGLLEGSIECSMVAKDPETGLWLCSRPDAIPTAHGDYSDVKVTADVSDLAVFKTLRNFGYHQQGALAWECAELLKLPFERFNLVMVEPKPPHCVRIVPIPDDDLALGRMQNRAMLRQIATCIERGIWPGPGEEDVRPLGLSLQEREYIQKRLQFYGL